MAHDLETEPLAGERTVAQPGHLPRPRAVEVPIGHRRGKYVITGVLGRGGMGVVYRALDRDLQREVALKVLCPELHHDADELRQESERLLREARAQAQLSHPNVVSIFDVGREGDEVYLAMELVPGSELRAWLRASPRGWREVVEVFEAVGRGLEAAHEVGLVHRDFKLANVLMGEDGRARVADFGLARRVQDPSRDEPESPWSDGAASVDDELTVKGTVVGTPAYMAPEQHAGQPPTAAVDQYAFCAALWEALAGRRPFVGNGLEALVRAKHEGPPPVPEPTEVPAAVWAVVERGLAARPDERFASMTSLLAELRRASSRGRRWRLAAGVGVAVLGGVGLLWPAPSESPTCPTDASALVGRWDDEARGRLRSAFEATGRSDRGEITSRVERALDDYAHSWLEQRREACEATRVRGEQDAPTMDRRMACLDRAGDALRRVVAALQRSDASGLDRATAVVATLPDPPACLRDDALPPEPSPEEEALAAELVELQVEVAAGRYEEALALADELRPRVEALGRPRLLARLGSRRAKALEGLARHDEAHDQLQAALAAAHEARDDRVVARIAAALAWNVGVHRSRAREGLGWVRTAEAAIERGVDEPSLRAEVLNARGVLAMDLGEVEAAAEAFAAALETIERDLGPEHLRMAGVLVNLAILEGQRGEHARAEVLQRRALSIRERAQGRDHPDTAAVLNNLSTTLVNLKRHEEALAANEEALARIRRVHGDEHPLVATFLVARGVLLYERGRRGEAAIKLREAAEHMERALGADHRNLAIVYNDLGFVLIEDGEPEPARRAFERSLSVMRINGAYEQETAVMPLVGLAWSLGALKKWEAARARWSEVLERLEQEPRPLVDHLPNQLRRAADAFEHTGDPERAAALRARADAEESG